MSRALAIALLAALTAACSTPQPDWGQVATGVGKTLERPAP